jgi:hypothetical protein
MAQPSSKIAEAFCGRERGREGDAKLRGDSVSSKSLLDPLTCADTEASAQSHQHGTEAFAEVSRALAAFREAVTPLAPEGRALLPRMAPGVGGFNIAPPTAQPTNRVSRRVRATVTRQPTGNLWAFGGQRNTQGSVCALPHKRKRTAA